MAMCLCLNDECSCNKPKPHVHQALIIAWANGAKIERLASTNGAWCDVDHPLWHEDASYRVKPEPKPDVIETPRITIWNPITQRYVQERLTYTWDGETGKLKSVEMI